MGECARGCARKSARAKRRASVQFARTVRASVRRRRRTTRYLVDPASSHMLVSKIKPCMSKHTPLYGEAANSSLQQPPFIRISLSYLDNCGNSRANTCEKARTARNERIYYNKNQSGLAPVLLVNLNNFADRTVLAPAT